MACQRCFGLCVDEYLLDNGHRHIAWRCVNCGNIVDPTIVRNRKNVGEEGKVNTPSPHVTEAIRCGLDF